MSLKRSKKVDFPQEPAPHPSAEQVELLVQEERETSVASSIAAHLVPVSLEILPIHAPLACAVYLKVAGKFVLFRNAGEKLTLERVASLHQKGATTIYLHRKSWQLFLETFAALSPGENASPMVKAEHVRNLLLVYGQELEKRIKDPKKPALDVLEGLAGQLADNLARDPAIGARLIRRHKDPALYFVGHSINVAIYSALVGLKVGISGSSLRALTYGGLMHDAGFLQIPRHIAYASAPLSPAQEDEYRDHARRGAELLQAVGAQPSVVLCAYQHHEREDGNGYPGRIHGNKLHPHAKIVSIADTFDDLVGPHPGKTAVSPGEAAESMRRMRGRFDPKLIDVVQSTAND